MQGFVRKILATVVLTAATFVTADTAHAQSPPPPSAATGVTIQPGNDLIVRVWPDSTLGGTFPVEETGLVYLPVIGEVHVAGMTLPEVRALLREHYGTAIKSAIVSITSRFQVSVLGSVARPGLYGADPTTTLFDMISVAGGFTGRADRERIRVLRGGQALEFNAERAIETGEAELALGLQPGDRIIVEPRRQPAVTLSSAFSVLQSIFILVSLVRAF